MFVGAYLTYLLCAMGTWCWPKYPQPEILGEGVNLVGQTLEAEPPPRAVLSHGGAVEGYYMISSGGAAVEAFEGIPYAEPPIGKNQFQPPVPKSAWTGTRLAKSPGPPCLQLDVGLLYTTIGSEDCLTLNVYAPKRIFAKNSSFPVFVFIHGGSFLFGSGADYGPSYLLNQDLILVNFNYRLGVLGFLSTGDSVVPGNNGLKDQVLALQWVRNNIGAFGGDPLRVTLGGHSAGGSSTHLHMMSRSRSLFQRAMSFSGTAFNYWAVSSRERSMTLTYRLAKRLRCQPMDPNRNNSEAILKCFRNRNPNFLVSNQKYLLDFGPTPLILFGPVVEPAGSTAFLTATPREMYKRKDFAKIPWITSCTKEEGYFILQLFYMTLKIPQLRREWWTRAPDLLNYESYPNKEQIQKKISKLYFKNSGFGSKQSNAAVAKALTLRFFIQGIHEASNAHASLAPTYSYVFDFQGKNNLANTIGIRADESGAHGGSILHFQC